MSSRSFRRIVPVTLALLAGPLLLIGCAHVTATGPRPEAGRQQPQHFAATRTVHAAYDYQLFLPRDYRSGKDTRWPLIVFLHGAGERGTNIARVTVHGPPKLVPARPDFPFVVVSPQCPEHRLWEVADLDALLDDVLGRYAVDPSRVYLTGLSMGGNGSWAWATARPERFAAVAPICGWGEPIRVWIASGPRRDALTRLPIWAFHGAKDTVVPPADSETMVAAFGRLGNKVRLTVYPDAGHDAWTATYDNPALYDWFLSNRRP